MEIDDAHDDDFKLLVHFGGAETERRLTVRYWDRQPTTRGILSAVLFVSIRVWPNEKIITALISCQLLSS